VRVCRRPEPVLPATTAETRRANGQSQAITETVDGE
jgi:hypothetical protein